jgi:hypothetical protein
LSIAHDVVSDATRRTTAQKAEHEDEDEDDEGDEDDEDDEDDEGDEVSARDIDIRGNINIEGT